METVKTEEGTYRSEDVVEKVSAKDYAKSHDTDQIFDDFKRVMTEIQNHSDAIVQLMRDNKELMGFTQSGVILCVNGLNRPIINYVGGIASSRLLHQLDDTLEHIKAQQNK